MIINRTAKDFFEKASSGQSSARPRPAIKMLDRWEIENMIRERAYKLFEQRGYIHGFDLDDWLKAEKIVTKV
ncbi:MAG: DUF2934 domain-containing protein [Candidatus Omnitrophica bacterium]|nr:DUF2934 domain-containing protein [Candidatus Omnitrophota bacterium]